MIPRHPSQVYQFLLEGLLLFALLLVDMQPQASGATGQVACSLRVRLWRVALRGRVFPRARQPSWACPGTGHEHGAVAVRAR